MRCPKPNNLIVSYISAGLGNQLFQYCAGRGLAAMAQCTLKVDVTSYARAGERAYRLAPMGVRAVPVDLWEQLRLRVSFGRRLHRVGCIANALFGTRRFRVIDDQQSGFQPDVLEARGLVFLRGYWESECYFRHIASQLRSELLANASHRSEDADLVKQMSEVNAVAVHVRRGDLVSSQRYSHVVVQDESYYSRARDFIESRVTNPHYFVFSDDPIWPQQHLNLGARVTFLNGEGQRADWQDLHLMARCKHFIIANSTFSWWAAWLATSSDKVVAAPRRWRTTSKEPPPDLIPSDWELL
jgi:hypothetical protein